MHTARGVALLEKAGLVEDQNRVRVGQGLQGIVPHDVAEGVGIPASATRCDRAIPRLDIDDNAWPSFPLSIIKEEVLAAPALEIETP